MIGLFLGHVIQPAALSRRLFKHGGKGQATKGKKPKGTKSSKSNADDDLENVSQSLPKKRKTNKRRVHSLAHSVENNISAARKH